MIILTREQVREIDRRAIEEVGLPGAVLMENAGRGVADLLLSLGVHGSVVICCGTGNNGGDGFVIARYLDNRNIPVRVLLFAEPEKLAGDAAMNFGVMLRAGIPVESFTESLSDLGFVRRRLLQAEWIVDALFGTGLTGSVRAPLDGVIREMNDSPARVLAVDIPSGLDCDTGMPLGCAIRAEHTATFVAPKVGFSTPGAAECLGRVHVIDIGVPRSLLHPGL